MCQTGTATTALSNKDWTIQTYLWNKTAKKQWMWTFRNDEFKYYEFSSDVTAFELDKDSPKTQLYDKPETPSAKIYYEKGSDSKWAIDGSQNLKPVNGQLDTSVTTMDAAQKVFTGCIRTDTT